ncbi:arylsulfatase [Novosphingobium resinovorum]|uniref:arylsulfatase n=1 Tax=Novosphingobium resinovorum TaxID=158500 RepID=UPI002ED1A6DC|nr:arylsulfatase [Novosphingobium resinovorum]
MSNFTSKRRIGLACLLGGTALLAGPVMAQDAANGAAAIPAQAIVGNVKPIAWPQEPQAPRGAPNILLIMTDDTGFGSTATFGGLIPTPNLDALARKGARYNAFNTTALCSPTRASLLTGREPHSVGMGNVSNLPTAYDGYTSVIQSDTGMVAQTLADNGYVTAAFGKWHLTPEWEQSSSGPFTRWPTGQGFSYFYGFHGGDTDQFAPALFENTLPIAPPADDPTYILDNDLSQRAIRWIRQQHDQAPQKPFFLYLAPGTAHSPHSAPREWLMKFRGKFDQGWDVVREQIFAQQKKAGIIPKDAKLTPRPDFMPAWNSLPADRKLVYSRLMEAYAAAVAYNDHEVGKVIESLKENGQYDNTMIVFIQGDNGSSAEGGLNGNFTEEAFVNQYPEDFEYVKQHIDDIGGPRAHNHYPAMWAWAMNAPFQYYKQAASHFGGVRNGMVVSWPGHINAPGQIRNQFLYVTDVAPTILDAAGIKQPEVQHGVTQRPLDGISFAYSFSQPTAASRRHTQVFEMMQNLGIYHDGWMASTKPAAAPWDITKAQKIDLTKRTWELYQVSKDYSQSRDLAAAQPAKLKEMQALFFAEAEKAKVLPIHGIADGAQGRPTLTEGRTSFTYHAGLTRVPENTAPHIIGRSFDITAHMDIPQQGITKGVIVTQGGRFGGYALYVKDGKPVFHYNMTNALQYRIASETTLTPGQHSLVTRFAMDKPERGSAATVTLLLDGREIATGRVEHTHRAWISNSEGFDVGEDTLTPINDDYRISGSRFTGTLESVRFDLK